MKRKIITGSLIAFTGVAGLMAQSSSCNINNSYSGAGIYGTDNAGFGWHALNTTGVAPGNTATGKEALTNNYGGEFNTADGIQALFNNTTGNSNVGLGFQSLYKNNGDNNTATGHSSLFSNTGGYGNTANGSGALYSNGSGYLNTAIGAEALYYNNVSGTVGDGLNNTAIGFQSLKTNNQGSYNTAFGMFSLLSSGSAAYNTALGYNALGSTVSGGYVYNTAIGLNAIGHMGGGNNNTAAGPYALDYNNGDMNTAAGYNALSNSTGDNNVAMGSYALMTDISGHDNVAVGHESLKSNDGYYNTAIGSSASLYYNNNGNQYNTSAGYGSLAYSGAGACNTMFGAFTDKTSIWGYSSAIGINAVVNSDSRTQLGDLNVLAVEGCGPNTTISDGRFKYNISEEGVKGLDFITRIKPVVYNFDTKKFADFLSANMPDSARKRYMSRDFSQSMAMRQSGFIAQDLEKAAEEAGYVFDAINKPEHEHDNYSVAYAGFVVPLVKAVQEQQRMIDAQKKINESLQQEVAERKQAIERFSSIGSNSVYRNDAIEKGFIFEAKADAAGKIMSVTFNIPADIKNAYIALYNQSGRQINMAQVNGKNTGAVTFTADNLPTGTYIYSIIADSRVAASKTIVIKASN